MPSSRRARLEFPTGAAVDSLDRLVSNAADPMAMEPGHAQRLLVDLVDALRPALEDRRTRIL